MRKIIIATRGSALALAQTKQVAARLNSAHPQLELELQVVASTGDTITHVPLAAIGGQGIFTKELEAALLERRADMAVHSLKDLPVRIQPGLTIACIPPRENTADALIVRLGNASLDELPSGAVVGTSSVRRKAQVLAQRPDVRTRDIRGNIDTRIRKLERGDYDAIVLARAGLNRLGLTMQLSDYDLPYDIMLPAPGQGALALEIREDDTELQQYLEVLNDEDTVIAVNMERDLLTRFGAGCHMPLGALGVCDGDTVCLEGGVFSPDGTISLKASAEGRKADWKQVVQEVYKALVVKGALDVPGIGVD